MGGRGGSGRSVAAPAAQSSGSAYWDKLMAEVGERAAKERAEREAAQAAPPTADELVLREIYEPLAARPLYNVSGQKMTVDIVSLRDLRDGLAARGWTRERQDATLRQLVNQRKASLIPESNQKAMSRRDREAAYRMGNEDKHLIKLDPRRN